MFSVYSFGCINRFLHHCSKELEIQQQHCLLRISVPEYNTGESREQAGKGFHYSLNSSMKLLMFLNTTVNYLSNNKHLPQLKYSLLTVVLCITIILLAFSLFPFLSLTFLYKVGAPTTKLYINPL